MTTKMFKFGDEARNAMLNGANLLANAVSVTLGPRGRNVVIGKVRGSPHITKDGVTVAKSVSLEDPFEAEGAELVKEAASKTADVAGDGTTTATVLAQAIANEGARLVVSGLNPVELKKGIDFAVGKVVEELGRISKPITSTNEIIHVGTISSNGDKEIGELISKGMEAVGVDGILQLEESGNLNTTLNVVNGYHFDRGWLSQYFAMKSPKLEWECQDPLILVTDNNVNNINVILPILEKTLKTYPGRPIFMVCDNLEFDALATIVANIARGTISFCAVKAPGFGDRKKEMLKDIAILTGATFVSDEMGLKLEHFDLNWYGTAKKVLCTSTATTITQGAGTAEAVEERVNQVRSTVEQADNEWDKEKLQERLAKLVGGIAVIHVGAPTETEMKEKKDRVEDALSATRAAVQEGIVPGGGVALLRASRVLNEAFLNVPKEFSAGVEIVKKALREPIRKIVNNAGGEAADVIRTILDSENPHFGYNAQTEVFEDLIEAGVMDPTKVVRCALQNAASVAGLLLTTECLIVDKPEPKNTQQNQNPHMM